MKYAALGYVPESEDPSLTLETRDLVVKVIDNTGLLAPPVDSGSFFNRSHRFTPFTHHLGYHGIRTLYHRSERRNVVAPFASWLSLQGAELEGVEPDPVDVRAWAGRGRGWPMRMERIGDAVVLRLDPLPSMRMGYRLELRPAEPDGLDFAIRFVFGRRPRSGPTRFRASWPCYVNGYDGVRLFYPRGRRADDWEWASLGEPPDIILGETVDYQHRQRAFRAEQQALPLAYGRIGENVLVMMFGDPTVRVYCVDSGGHLFSSPVQNPAWDFEWALDDPPCDSVIGFDGRLVYTRYESASEVLRRYREWRESRGA